MTRLHTRKLLRALGLLGLTQSIKKRLAYVEKGFMPCTPHLLIAVHQGLEWCKRNGLTENGDYLEFGLFRGFTLWYAQALARGMGLQRMRFFGFDSFFGLPPTRGIDQGSEFHEGAYYSSREEVKSFLTQYGVDWGRTFLVEGWFKQILNPPTRERYGLESCSLCVVDCDLYESTCLVLEFIRPLIQHPLVILFDDWANFGGDPQKGEQRAFSEFLGRNPSLQAERFVEFGGHGKGFILRRRPP